MIQRAAIVKVFFLAVLYRLCNLLLYETSLEESVCPGMQATSKNIEVKVQGKLEVLQVSERTKSPGQKQDSVRLFLCTWNVGGSGPPKDLDELLDLQQQPLPDIYGIGFQELDLSDKEMLDNVWTSRLTDVLGQLDYVRIKVIRMQAISLQVFVKKSLLLLVTGIESEYSKAGMGGWWGNKGGVSIRFEVGGVKIIIVNTHLAAHMENMAERIEDFNTVLNTQKFRDPDVRNILDHDYIFWIGDLNCRLEGISKDDVISLIEQKKYDELLKYDQLKKAQNEELIFVDFKEGPLNFNPTYKFNKDTDVYDTSEKQRVPAWCDRILWKTHTDLDGLRVAQRKYFTPTYNKGDHKPVAAHFDINLLYYKSCPMYKESDHKPMTGAFDVNVFSKEEHPFVTFNFMENWKSGKDIKFHYTVRCGINPDTSPWDWIGLFQVNFKHFDDHKTYVYGVNNAEKLGAKGVDLEFKGIYTKVPAGKYILCYISKYKGWLRGMSNIFKIE